MNRDKALKVKIANEVAKGRDALDFSPPSPNPASLWATTHGIDFRKIGKSSTGQLNQKSHHLLFKPKIAVKDLKLGSGY